MLRLLDDLDPAVLVLLDEAAEDESDEGVLGLVYIARGMIALDSDDRLEKIADRLDVLKGYMVVFLNLDEVIAVIRDEDDPRAVMKKRWKLNDAQVDAILNMRLRSLRRLEEIAIRERLDAHRVVEDFMISANVAAAKALEEKGAPVVYRVHETPSREKLMAFKEYLASQGRSFAMGQVITPGLFNRMLKDISEPAEKALIIERENEIAEWRSSILRALERLSTQSAIIRSEALKTFAEPVRACLSSVLPRVLEHGGDREVARAIVDVVSQQAASRISVSVSADDLDRLAEALSDLEPEVPVDLEIDRSLLSGQVSMTWPDGGANVDPDLVLSRAIDVLDKRLARTTRSPEPDE